MSMLSPNEEVDISMGGSDRNNQNDIRWHLDRKIPIALLVALFFQSCAAMWWAATVNTRVDQLERGQVNAYAQAERIIRLETKMDSIFITLTDIKSALANQNRGSVLR